AMLPENLALMIAFRHAVGVALGDEDAAAGQNLDIVWSFESRDFPAPLTASPPFPDSTALLAAVVFANHGSTVRRFLAFQRREVHTIALRAPPRNPSSSTGSACGYVLIAQRGRRSLVLGDLIKQRLCLASERKGRIGDKGDQHRDRFLFAGAHEGGGRLIADARIGIRQRSEEH